MKSKWIVILFASLFIMSSCSSYKNVPYLQNPEVVNELKKELPLYICTIRVWQLSNCS